MVKKSNRKLKQTKYESEDEVRIKSLIIIFVVVVLVCVGIYFLTEGMIKKESNKANSIKDVEIKYDIATIGTMFNRIEDEYYVLIYSNEKDGNSLNSVLDTYRSSDNYLKTYFIDLDKKVNSIASADNLVLKPTNSKEVKVNGATLYKLVNGEVIECISGVDEIIKVLES